MSARGYQLPRRAMAGAAATPPTPDTKADSRRGCSGPKAVASRSGGTLQPLFLAVLLFAPDDSIVHFVFEEGFGQRAMLGAVDLVDWADEGDLERAAVRILPVVGQFVSNPGLMRIILGDDLSGRLRAFIEGRDLTVETLRNLHSDLILASVPPCRKRRHWKDGMPVLGTV